MSAAALRVEQKLGFEALVCPVSGQSLCRRGNRLTTADGLRSYPILREVPHFAGVGRLAFLRARRPLLDREQLDAFRDDHSSEITLLQKTGLTPGEVRGKLVLEVGVGSGRFADVLARWGASVIGVGSSAATAAASVNFAPLPNVLICQADLARLPFRPDTFDYILSIGGLHHTPDAQASFQHLPRFLKPRGEIAVWVSPSRGKHIAQGRWAPFTSRLPSKWLHSFCKVFVPWAHRRPSRLRGLLRLVFPVAEQGLGLETAIVDTFDGYARSCADTFSSQEVKAWFSRAGLGEIHEYSSHTAVRGRRPAA